MSAVALVAGSLRGLGTLTAVTVCWFSCIVLVM